MWVSHASAGKPGRSLWQDVALRLQLLDLATQLGQFFPLGCAQAFLAGQGLTRITSGLAYPILKGLRGNLELPGELGWRSASTNQFNYLLAKFSRIGRMGSGLVDSLKVKY